MNLKVSVNCTTYNHEQYIAMALKSFLQQQTDFDFEILVGEDCSTDSTRTIVEEYSRLYPDRIRLMASPQNMGSIPNSTRLRENSQGKYIALCEGDDFWTDPLKLQRQVDYLEAHPECALCFHAAIVVTSGGAWTSRMIRPRQRDAIITPEELIRGGGQFFHTGALMFPRRIMEDLPPFYYHSPVGDFPTALICASRGTVAYLDVPMSAYRNHSPGSWTTRMVKNNAANIQLRLRLIQMMHDFDEFTNRRFATAVSRRINCYRTALLYYQIRTLLDKNRP